MAERRLGIIVHGATGRMGMRQHLANSLVAIRREGGLALANGDRLMPDPVLIGRNADKLERAARQFGIERWGTDLDVALADPSNDVFFDCASSGVRPELVRRAIAAGKHIYVEKPIAPTFDEAMEIARLATRAGLKNAVIQDKLFLPGLQKLQRIKDHGFFGRILSMRLDFGWWIFDGEVEPGQRSSWNYKKAEGGGLVLDMYAHWRYIIDRLVAPIRSVSSRSVTLVPVRRDERGEPYDVDVEDAAYATMELDGGIIAAVSNSWCTRARADDLLTIQIDGTQGSAIAGLHRCWTQSIANTPKPVWDVNAPQAMDLRQQWQEVPDNQPFQNSFRSCWEGFLRHVAEDAPFWPTLLEGAKGVQLAELSYLSSRERRWVDVPELTL